MKQSAELAVEEINATGGILGSSVQAYVVDDHGSASTGREIARELALHGDIVGVIGHYSSDITIASSNIYREFGLALISPIASNPSLTEHGLINVFRFTNRDDRTAHSLAGYLRECAGKRRAVIIESRYPYGKSMSDSFERAFIGADGEVVARHQIEPGARDFGKLIGELPVNFDLLFYGGAFEGASLLKALRQSGRPQLFAAGDGCWDRLNFLEPAGPAAGEGEGVLILAATPESKSGTSQQFIDRYTKRYGLIINYAINSYDSARILLLSMKRAAEENGAEFTRSHVMASLRSIQFQGIAYSRPVQWDHKGDNMSAVTALYIARDSEFHQIAEIPNS